MRNNKFVYIGFIALPFILILLCYCINLIVPDFLMFPKPLEIILKLFELFENKDVISALYVTITTLFLSLVIAIVIGMPFGYLLGYNLNVWNTSQPTIDFFRSIPVTFLIPIIGLLLGINNKNIVWILSSYPETLVIIFSVRAGIIRQDSERLHFFKIISGKNSLVSSFRVTFFEILPDLFSGFRIALSYGIVIVTVLEYMRLGNQLGLGCFVNDELEKQHYSSVYSLVLLIGFVGYFLNKIVELVQNKFIYWSNENPSND